MNCGICSKKISGDISLHLKHVKQNHPFEMTYKCIYYKCYRKFPSFSSLQKHSYSCSFQKHQVQDPITLQDDSSLQTCVIFKNSENIPDSNLYNSRSNSLVERDIGCNNIQNCILKFVAQLYNKPNISRSAVQKIIEQFQDTLQNVSDYFIQNLKTQLPSELHINLNNCFDIPMLKEISSEYRRFEYLRKCNYFISPQSFLIGELLDNKKKAQKTILTVRKCEGQIVLMRETLKVLLELPGFYKQLLSVLETNTSATYINKTYTSVCDGTIWTNIREHYVNKTVIPLFLYYDDFETCNPLGSAAGIHKVGALYCSIATLPPRYASLLENIFLVQLIHSEDRTYFGNDKCFRNVIEELKYLSNTGIVIRDENGCEHKVYFILIALLGDNLGLNSLLGFHESFSTDFFCRICRANKLTTRSQTVENKKLLRTSQNYSEDVSELVYGVKEECIFNEVPHFDCSINITCDIMHDLFEGVCRYDLAKIIQHFLTQKFFSIDKLNERIKYFNHQSGIDRGNKMPLIKIIHLQKGYLIMTAAEMSALISYFTFIVGDLVPYDDEVWEFYLTICEIINIVTDRIISDTQINLLRCLIISHHETYIRLFNDHLKPKYHFMIHYPNIIRRMGSLKNLSSIRYEGFHKLSKTYASIVTSRKNITLTLAMKLQLHCCYRFLSKAGLEDKIEVGPEKGFISNDSDADLLALIRREILSKATSLLQFSFPSLSDIDNSLMEVSWIQYNNVMFKPKCVIITNNDENDLAFGIVRRIILKTGEIFVIVYQKCVTLGLDTHFKAYEIELPHKNNLFGIYIINILEECDVKTCNFHVSGEGRYFISIFDV